MQKNNEIMQVSKIDDHIYLSGIFPFDENQTIIKNLNIKYILCCVDKEYVVDVHNKIMMDNPTITILYLPYNDDSYQNLWIANKNLIKITSYTTNNNDHNKLSQTIKLYNNKPLIEIGYHFIDTAVDNGDNILVHCMAGISRSASLVIYYLMKKRFIDYDKALRIVNLNRSISSPNDSFRSQLTEYETKRDLFTESDANSIIEKSTMR